jgi:hypothetical protein
VPVADLAPGQPAALLELAAMQPQERAVIRAEL